MKAVLRSMLAAALLLCVPAQADNHVNALHDLFDREWQFRLKEFPTFATYVGVHNHNDKLGDVSAGAEERRFQAWQAFLKELQAIDREGLPREEQVNYSLFERQLTDAIAAYTFGAWQIPLNADSGFHTAFARMPDDVPLATVKDYQDYIARLNAWPRYVRQQIANMRIGLERGMTLPAVTLAGIDDSLSPHVVSNVSQSVFFSPFAKFPDSISDAERDALVAAGRKAISDSVVPAYASLRSFLRDEYIPGARTTIGASELPDGKNYYRQRIEYFTTLALTADEIHELGLSEVRRIRAEMLAVIESVGFDGSFEEFLYFLRNDPQFYAETPEELLKEASHIAKTMDGKLPSLFGHLPRLPYGVAPVPEHMAPRYTAGRYVPAAQGGTQPGWYWVNTYKLESRPLYALPALTLHEAVPGHHLQFALSLEQGEQPPFRRFDYISAFGEGWGLYAEWLGKEAGIYEDPYDDFGRLTYEMWRACRLVVDTGIHSKGWTRKQAMDFMAGNTALSLHEVETETDRYISWPAQALSYKLGELKIRALRKHAEKALGADFDLRAFHDALLVNGSVTLPLLEEIVERFITEHSGMREAAGDR
ncbi:MAG: DUF885 domain-containing protein [Gammaproteobacteria bacterium]|nr:DUF885 domain-containing protein [Gammaproteobacteria bacterium]